MKKKLAFAGLVIGLSVVASMPAFAGEWKQKDAGWWYQKDDGSWYSNCWQWLDGNNDGVSECYYFNADGYCLLNTTTPDGYLVNADGAWVENGVVQTRTKTAASGSGSNDYMDYDLPYAGITNRKYDGMSYGEIRAIEREAADKGDWDEYDRAFEELLKRSKILMNSPQYDAYRRMTESELWEKKDEDKLAKEYLIAKQDSFDGRTGVRGGSHKKQNWVAKGVVIH